MTHKPTDITKAQVKALSAFLPQVAVAKYMGITRKTLMKHYADIIHKESSDKDLQVVKGLFMNAVEGNVSAQIFWCKTRLGMSENTANAHIDEEEQEDGKIDKIEVVIAKPQEVK